MTDPATRRLDLSKTELTELALRLQAKQPQLRILTQRQIAARVLLQVTNSALAETTDELLEKGRFAEQTIKDQFMAMRKTKEEAERTIDFYQSAGNALAALFLSNLPQASYADAAGKRMIELGDEWERCRADRPRADAIRLLLRDLSYTLIDLPLTPPQDGLDLDSLREKRMKDTLANSSISKLGESGQSATQPARGSAKSAAPAISATRTIGSTILPARNAIKPTRAELVTQMASRTAQWRRSGVPQIKPINEPKARKNSSPRTSSSSQPVQKKSRRGA